MTRRAIAFRSECGDMGRERTRAARATGLALGNGDDVEAVQVREVCRVAGVERQLVGDGDRSDEQVDGPATMRLATGGEDGCVDAPVGPGRRRVEGERVEGGLRALEPVLTARALRALVGRVRTGGQL